jgi:hypothetical protein
MKVIKLNDLFYKFNLRMDANDWVEPLKKPFDLCHIVELERGICQTLYNDDNDNNDNKKLDPFFEMLFKSLEDPYFKPTERLEQLDKQLEEMYSNTMLLSKNNISQQEHEFNEFCKKYSKDIVSIGDKINTLDALLDLAEPWFIQNPPNVHGFENYLLEELKANHIHISSIKSKCIISGFLRLYNKYKK